MQIPIINRIRSVPAAVRSPRLAAFAVASAAVLLCTLPAQPASAAQALDAIQGAVSGKSAGGGSALGGLGGLAGGGIPSLDSVGTGNVTGLVGYCAKNNLLGGDAADVKAKLMG